MGKLARSQALSGSLGHPEMNKVLTYESSLGEAWEGLVMRVWQEGRVIDTEYGEKSKDISPCGVLIATPQRQPFVHKAAFAWHKKGSYAKEILEGTEDHRIGKDLSYTYHQRLFRWPWLNDQVQDILRNSKNPNCPWAAEYGDKQWVWVDQFHYVFNKLKQAPYSRRAQMITWNPLIDETTDSPPCLQWVWCRIVDDKLEMHTYWRSRDLWKAWWLNAYAFIQLQAHLATLLKVKPGPYTDISASLHIYERDWKQVEENFIEIVRTRKHHDRFMWRER